MHIPFTKIKKNPPGNAEITEMILDAGAETDLVNSVGRTAAQMAAFVGEEYTHTHMMC